MSDRWKGKWEKGRWRCGGAGRGTRAVARRRVLHRLAVLHEVVRNDFAYITSYQLSSYGPVLGGLSLGNLGNCGAKVALSHEPRALSHGLCAVVVSHLSSLIPHLSSLIFHPSSFIPHLSSLIFHPSSFIPHLSSLIFHLSSLIAHCSLLIAHCSSLIALRSMRPAFAFSRRWGTSDRSSQVVGGSGLARLTSRVASHPP